jgi:hypothetical protein
MNRADIRKNSKTLPPINRVLTLEKFQNTASYEQGSDIRKNSKTLPPLNRALTLEKIPKHCLL